ncbi:hypothetical protein V6O07_10305, partial [Arthrospira platensis SPKY2]
IIGINGVIHHTTKDEVRQVLIQDKERVISKSGDQTTSKYLIFTDREVFENTDTVWGLKWNSSDVYGKIQRGQICDFEVTGFRIPFMSVYRNILSASCATPE